MHPYRLQIPTALCILLFLSSRAAVVADGMVYSEVHYPRAVVPNQQALIHHADNVEHLVIETSFLGEGTNFAWVVPLPSTPQVSPVSENFFSGLQEAFQPTLLHRVTPYYAGILFLVGLAFLGARALRDERSCVTDLPLCLALGMGAWLVGGHMAFGVAAAALAFGIRLFARSSAAYALLLLVGASFSVICTLAPNARWPRLFDTLGQSEVETSASAIAGVSVVSIQRAGVFESTTLKAISPAAVLRWLEENGYQAPPAAEPAIRDYIDRGWVFVASKARTDHGPSEPAALHPLAFTFASKTPVYPTRLTATGGHECSIALYIFGNRRATAPHFSTVRCERLAQQVAKQSPRSNLRITDPEVLALIGDSTIGTKLLGRMTPAQMASDVDISSRFFWSIGRRVFSYSGAIVVALNIALPLAAIGWLLAGMSQGGWKVDTRWVSRWRKRSLWLAAGVGIGVFLLLPKAEVETTRRPRRDHGQAPAQPSPPVSSARSGQSTTPALRSTSAHDHTA